MFATTIKMLQRAQNIAIFSHRNPDGDALGSNLALHLALKKLLIKSTPVCVDHPPAVLHFLPHIDELVTSFDPEDFDLFVFLDCADIETLSGFYPRYKTFFETKLTINIDHHPSNKLYAIENVVDKSKAATALLVYDLLQEMKIRIDPEIATCLLTGIITDTGGFQHSNTSPETLSVASDLTDKGANLEKIVNAVFKSKSLTTLRLWGKALSRISLDKEKNLVWSSVTKEDISELGASYDDLSGVISFMFGIPEAKVAILLAEREDGKLKGSIRTKNGADANELAAFFGGGGHKKAAGFVVKQGLGDSAA
ncbi:MAG: bifunctional oligoribonuclease/PAP phosphatase NrnA [bacterium]